nr:unnamed protein product [Spirometra erinaceieuropaei]
MPSAMLMDTYCDERPEILIVHRTDSQIFNLWRIHFRSNVLTIPVHELLFANDCALNITLEGHMQRSIYLFTAAGDNFGLVINTEKTVVMRQLPPDAAEVTPHINVKET